MDEQHQETIIVLQTGRTHSSGETTGEWLWEQSALENFGTDMER